MTLDEVLYTARTHTTSGRHCPLVYTHGGHPRPELISPDKLEHGFALLDRPNARGVELDLFYDYRTNVHLYPQWQTFLTKQQPKAIIFWVQDDIFFTREGGESYLKDLPMPRCTGSTPGTLRSRTVSTRSPARSGAATMSRWR